ncbi:zinc-binding dehydrogenase [Roseivivax sp. GX 12232]|uniref:zinc-binding dehydrogenase n=1 Tax=Roseivivax sp. GX 12232 TaxID=2900547 RepID=UPI001E53A6F0|nr:zinc-binding dehydrogenase [Roseivivax sp. GX 12232]MCE0507321.1 zinc-binding dehydrogenase [Roseivivax sp. GX 12232]
MSNTNREWVLCEYKGIDGLALRDYSPEDAGPGEVRLKVEAFALNWGDMDLMQGRYSFNFSTLPARIGCEAVGIVDQVGEGVTGIEVGERYCTLPYFYDMNGTSGGTVIREPRYLTKAPEGLDAVEAGSIWMQFMTAYYPIAELAKAGPGVNILVTAATSTAGRAALEIGAMKGATMIGTSRHDYNRDYLYDGGASHVYFGSGEGLAETIKEATNGVGVHAVFDSVGAGMIGHYSKALAKDAQIFFYGTLDENLPILPMMELYQANATFKPYSLFHYIEDADWKQKGLDFVYRALDSGKIAPTVDRVFPMEEYREAWEYMRAPRKSHGKVVVKL